jgi:hypothetical protein
MHRHLPWQAIRPQTHRSLIKDNNNKRCLYHRVANQPGAQDMNNQDISENDEKMDGYILETYETKIRYYWKEAGFNRKKSRFSNSAIIILGILLTIITTITALDMVPANYWINTVIKIATPILAATITLLVGFLRKFQWGAKWRDMVAIAIRIEKERDRFLATPPVKRNYDEELSIIKNIAQSAFLFAFEDALGSANEFSRRINLAGDSSTEAPPPDDMKKKNN